MKRDALRSLVGVALILGPLLLDSAEAHAQQGSLIRACLATAPHEEYCNLVAQAVTLAQPRLVVALAGGDPVPGASSTLGPRLGEVPRVSVAGRLTGAWVKLPPIRELREGGDIQFIIPSADVDLSVGIFPGFSPAPGVAGLASLDLLGSIGWLPEVGAGRLDRGTAASWAAGARVGLLRETFTLPGAAVSVLYRRVGSIEFGDVSFQQSEAYFRGDLSVVTVRGTVGKRVPFVGLVAGLGYDRYSSDVAFGLLPPGSSSPVQVTVDDLTGSRYSAFVNLGWTLLVFQGVGEIGWQWGEDLADVPFPEGVRFESPSGTVFGSLALRLSL